MRAKAYHIYIMYIMIYIIYIMIMYDFNNLFQASLNLQKEHDFWKLIMKSQKFSFERG